MQGKELINKAFQRQHVERIPWVPFVGCHAAQLTGKKAGEYLQSATLMLKGVNKAVELYQPDGIPVAFDLQIEAEAMGCRLHWADDNPPSVISHPLSEGIALSELKLPDANDGRIPVVLETARLLREKHPELALYGLITGPFTLALHLLGTDIFMKMFEDPDYVHQLMNFTSDVAAKMAEQYIESGCDVIAVVDPMISQIDPDSFSTFIQEPSTRVFKHIREAGALSSYFVCGNATQNIEVMCQCKPDNISIDENIDLTYVKEMAEKYQLSFGGNMRLTVVLLMGSTEDAQREALECMDLGGKEGFVLAPGCDLPMATPSENLKAVSRLNHDELLQGELRASTATIHEVEQLDLSSHWSDEQVIVDVITLDSSSCAPCQYMVDAVERAARRFNGKVQFKEHRIKDAEGVQMMFTLGVRNLPTIVMDGNIEFISQIPPIHTIEERIEHYLSKKKN
ncbi:uroporphyrinogen decarboxylase family protein [Roseimarinus sediminis]|uniref:uroporphyrinogen decarboxylase family protein n=1 Tax=Roseimarinus sediminis TaxID=1610899 RepID=UPI003D25560E